MFKLMKSLFSPPLIDSDNLKMSSSSSSPPSVLKEKLFASPDGKASKM
jgi:hypothetical protein